MKVHRGKTHRYLGMSLDFSHKGKCVVTMYDYVDGIIKAWDEAAAKHEQGFKPVTWQKYYSVAPGNLFTGNEDLRSFQRGWQQTTTLLLQKHSMSRNGQDPAHAFLLHF